MRVAHLVAWGLAFGAASLLAAPRASADGLLPRHCNDCDAKPQVIRLPSQQIQVITTPPQVVVNQAVGPRVRGVMAVPLAPQPIVATILSPQALGWPAPAPTSSAANVLSAYHALELQALEVARQKAAHAAEIKAINNAHQRIQSSLAGLGQSAGDSGAGNGDLATQINNLTERINAIEKLLLVHDAALKDVLKKQSK